MSASIHFSSQSNEWATPQEVFDGLNAEFDFTLDPCATSENAKCAHYFSISDDGLTQAWAPERVFMNPPYGREIGKWVKKAFEESQAGALVVCLIPARTDTAYWHEYVAHGDVRFLRGRLGFQRADRESGKAPFPSAVVIFRPAVNSER